MSDQPTPGDGREIRPPEDVPPVSAEELVDGAVADEAGTAADERRYPSTIGGAVYLLVLAAVAVGLLVVAFGDWRLGIRVMAGSLLAAALARTALPGRDAGMLAVRNRPIDVAVLVVIGALMIWLAGSIPNQPGA